MLFFFFEEQQVQLVSKRITDHFIELALSYNSVPVCVNIPNDFVTIVQHTSPLAHIQVTLWLRASLGSLFNTRLMLIQVFSLFATGSCAALIKDAYCALLLHTPEYNRCVCRLRPGLVNVVLQKRLVIGVQCFPNLFIEPEHTVNIRDITRHVAKQKCLKMCVWLWTDLIHFTPPHLRLTHRWVIT